VLVAPASAADLIVRATKMNTLKTIFSIMLVCISSVILSGCQTKLSEPVSSSSSTTLISFEASSSSGVLKISSASNENKSSLYSSSSFATALSSISPISSDANSSSSNGINLSSSITALDDSLNKLLTSSQTIKGYFENSDSNIQVLVYGSVTSLLSDDTVGARHQRFIVKIDNGMTLLIAHNIDIGVRLPNEILHQYVYVYGEYFWNSQGGGVHWTHKDPDGVHIDGFIDYKDTKYQ